MRGVGILLAPLQMLMEKIQYIPQLPEFQQDNANTSILEFSGKTYALTEVD